MDPRALVKSVMGQHSVKVHRQSAHVGIESSIVKLSVLLNKSLAVEESLEGVDDIWAPESSFANDDGSVRRVSDSDAEESVLVGVSKSCILIDVDFDVYCDLFQVSSSK